MISVRVSRLCYSLAGSETLDEVSMEMTCDEATCASIFVKVSLSLRMSRCSIVGNHARFSLRRFGDLNEFFRRAMLKNSFASSLVHIERRASLLVREPPTMTVF